MSVEVLCTPLSRSSKNQLSSNLTKSLEYLVFLMGQIHADVQSNNADQFKRNINKMMEELSSLQVFTERGLAYHEKAYLNRQIQQMKEYLNVIVFSKTNMKKNLQQLKKLNKELIYISRFHDLNRQKQQYGFYFCPKDDSVWIQKSGTKIYHPFKENYRNCGRKIH